MKPGKDDMDGKISNNQNKKTLNKFLEERRATDWIKICCECQRTICNSLQRKSPLLADQSTLPNKVSKHRDRVNFKWKIDCFFLANIVNLKNIILIALIDNSSEYCQCKTKLSDKR